MSQLLPIADYDSAIVAARDSFLTDLAAVPADARVPALAGWTVTDLAEHLSRVHLWATAVVGGSGPRVVPPTRPADVPILDWYGEAADAMLDAMRSCPADRECWTFSGPGTVEFWYRRQAHETAMHALDLGTVLGRPPTYPATISDDGVDEVFGSMLPGQHAREPVRLEGAVAIRAIDTGGAWLVEPASGTESPPWRRSADPVGAAVQASAPVSDLVLGLWGRLDPLTAWTVSGEREVLRRLLSQRLTP